MFRLFHREPSSRRAEKLVARGKIEAAIREYRRVLRETPEDTSTLNRVGDLYSRVNKFDEATHLYRQTAERFVAEGFYVKAIAVYKKIHRLDPSQIDVYEKLAELYKLQGLVNDSRIQYEALADHYERQGDIEAVRSVARELVELQPQDLSQRLRLVEVCERLGDQEGVRREYLEIARTMFSEGALERATQVLERAVDAGVADADFLVASVGLLRAEGHAAFAETLLADAARQSADDGGDDLMAEVHARLERDAELAKLAEPDVVPPEPARDEAPVVEEAEAGPPSVGPPSVGPPSEAEREEEAESYVLVPPEEEAAEPAPRVEDASDRALGAEAETDIEDHLGEIEVFVKYGFRERALDRLGEVLRVAPHDLRAHRMLVELLLDDGAHRAAMEAANEMATAAAATGDTAAWREVRQRLLATGFLVEDDDVKAPPAFVEEGGEEFDLLEAGGEALGSILEAAKQAAAEEDAVILEPPKKEEEPSAASTLRGPERSPADAGATDEEERVDFVVVDDEFADLAAEVEREMEADTAPAGEAEPPSLDEIVESFKQGVAAHLSPEDFDTHYNLGIAYREMGLVDEAIGEFEIAARSPDYIIGCCSLLGLCYREKGDSDAAMHWYRQGLEMPELSEEERLALLYDLAEVYEMTGDKASALDAFSEISGVSSDYRDVDARLAALQAQ